ncbi:MAG: peptidoglycan D,D-transpeptidase FtsI family protein, partial [Alphaproteobacteria bacterium]
MGPFSPHRDTSLSDQNVDSPFKLDDPGAQDYPGALGDPGGERHRFRLVAIGLMVGFGALGVRLADLGLFPPADYGAVVKAARSVVQPRPDILDRNGAILATDIKVASLIADPRRIIDVGDTLDQLTLVLPNLNRERLKKRLSANSSFAWIKRGLTPKLQARIHDLGLPGISFIPEVRRVYPAGRTFSHVVGHVTIDNKGMAGIESYIERHKPLSGGGLSARVKPAPVRLSVDLRVQHVMRNELGLAMKKFNALAAAAVLLDTQSGEVLGLVSLPDYDPSQPKQALLPDRINRITKGVYELGSTFKTFTVAMGLDTGVVSLDGGFDASRPIRVGRFTINDFHGKKRFLTVPEIFIYSSNIGAAKMALAVGLQGHQAFLRRLGLLDRLQTELPEVGGPLLPKPWRPISSMTVSY